MKRAWLYLALPLLGAVLVGAGFSVFGGSQRLSTLENLVVFGLATAGSLGAALSFKREDYLSRVWLLLALCPALLFSDALLFGAATAGLPRGLTGGQALVSGALTIGANVASVWGLVLVARAWRAAGLDLQVSPAAYWGSVVTVIVLAGALLGHETLGGVQEVVAGQFDALTTIASNTGDLLSAAMLVPLLLTARSLRGGALVWPWGLLTLSVFLWLAFDAVAVAAGFFDAPPERILALEEALRAGACLAQLAAGLAQRRVVGAALVEGG